ncbi:MAG: head GIN domain-containing protein [Bacteroidota bacterium]
MKHSARAFMAICLGLLLCIPVLAQNITGNGHVQKETRNHSGFTGVQVGGAFDVILTQGSSYRVIIESDDNVLPHIKTKVENGVLKIHTKGNFRKVNTMKAYVTLPELDKLDVSGAADVIGKSTFRTHKMDIGSSGASDIVLAIEVNELHCGISGSADINLSGTADEVHMGVSGSGDLNGEELYARRGKAGISGSGSVKVHLSDALTASVSGAGDIVCYGNPSSRTVQTSGSGEVHFAGGGSTTPVKKPSNSGKVY